MGRAALTDMDRNPGDICEGDADDRLSLESLKKVVAIAPLPAGAAAAAAAAAEDAKELFVAILEGLCPLLLLAPGEPAVIQDVNCCVKDAAVEGG